MSKIYRIFISHSWCYTDAYSLLINLLDDAKYFTYQNYSVPKDDPIDNAPNSSTLYQAIKQQMAPCHIVLIMGGVYSTYSTWINKEIKIAQTEFLQPKPIVGIRPWSQTNISSSVQNASLEIVSWNTNSIVSAIRKYSI